MEQTQPTWTNNHSMIINTMTLICYTHMPLKCLVTTCITIIKDEHTSVGNKPTHNSPLHHTTTMITHIMLFNCCRSMRQLHSAWKLHFACCNYVRCRVPSASSAAQIVVFLELNLSLNICVIQSL